MAEIILLPWVSPKAAGLRRGTKYRVAKLPERRAVEQEEDVTVLLDASKGARRAATPRREAPRREAPRQELLEPRLLRELARCRYKRGGMTKEECRRATQIRVVRPTHLREGGSVALFLEDDWVIPVAHDWLTTVWEQGFAVVAGRLVIGVEPTMDGVVYALRQDVVEGSVEVSLAHLVTDRRGKRRLDWMVE